MEVRSTNKQPLSVTLVTNSEIDDDCFQRGALRLENGNPISFQFYFLFIFQLF